MTTSCNTSTSAVSGGTAKQIFKNKPSSRPMIEEITSESVMDSGSSTSCSTSERTPCGSISDSAFKKAMALVGDPIIPVQGHGLICLRRLVDSGDEETLSSSEPLFEMCLHSVGHNDSYVYLNAVHLLAALVVRSPRSLLPNLVREYLCQQDVMSANDDKNQMSAEHRMKLGEVLVKVSASLGKQHVSCVCNVEENDCLAKYANGFQGCIIESFKILIG